MNARKIFEAYMRSKGHENFELTQTGKYVVPAVQTRWIYFQLGWETRGASA